MFHSRRPWTDSCKVPYRSLKMLDMWHVTHRSLCLLISPFFTSPNSTPWPAVLYRYSLGGMTL